MSLIIPVLSVLSVPSVLFFIPCSVPSVPQGNSVPRALRAFDMFRALRALFKIPCPPCFCRNSVPSVLFSKSRVLRAFFEIPCPMLKFIHTFEIFHALYENILFRAVHATKLHVF